jgi:hypothetical protein
MAKVKGKIKAGALLSATNAGALLEFAMVSTNVGEHQKAIELDEHYEEAKKYLAEAKERNLQENCFEADRLHPSVFFIAFMASIFIYS